MNIDYTITCNGLKLADEEKTVKSRSHNYAGIDASIVEAADRIANTDMRVGKNVNVGAIATEEGMGPVLSEKRDIVYDNAVIAPVADFDKVWDQGVQDYLNAGGQAIMDEREEKWVATYGDVDMLP